MPLASSTPGSLVLSTMVGIGLLVSTPGVNAAVPPAATIRASSQSNPQLNKFIADATQALQTGNNPLAVIQIKNALRLDPNNTKALTLLGIALLRSGDAVPAEHQLRQARLLGAKDQDILPALVQSMVFNKEWDDLLGQFAEPASDDKSSLAAIILNARALAYQFTGDDSDAIASINRSLQIKHDMTGLLTRVRIAMLQSNLPDSMTYINQALALDPNNADALMTKAEILSGSDKAAALAIVNGVLQSRPYALNAIMAQIELLIELGRDDEAQKSVDAVLNQIPDLTFATFYKALLLGIHNKPLDGWRIAQSLPADFIQSQERYAIGTAQLAIRSGALDTASSILTTYAGQHPAAVDAHLQLAELHLKLNNPNNALNDLSPLMDSKDPRVIQLIANLYETLKRPADAVVYLRKLDAVGSKNSAIKYQLALTDLNQDNTSQGVREMLDGMAVRPGDLSGPQAAIDLLLKQSKFVEAQTLADQAEKTNPKSPVPPFFKWEILFAQTKYDEAATAVTQSLQRDPHYLPGLDAKAQVLLAQNKYTDAANIWNQLQALQPNNPVPDVKLAQIAALSNRSAQSVALLEKAISKDPKRIDTRLTLAQYQASLKDYAGAQATLKAALSISQKDPQVLTLYGQVEQLQGQTAAAVATNKLLVQENQQSSAAQAQLASSLLANGDERGAISAFRRSVELTPGVVQFPTLLVHAQIQIGDSEGALATAREWANDHKSADGALLLAQTLAQLKRFPEALSVIAESQRSIPDWRFAVLDSQIADVRGNDVGAIAILKNWLADHRSDIDVRLAYANALLRANDNAAALEQYENILKSRKDIPVVLNNTAWLVKDTNLTRALSLATSAVQLEPSSPDMNDTLGCLLLKKGDATDALPPLESAHAGEPNGGEISYHLALALSSVGRKADAKKVIQEALAIDDKFADAAYAKKLLQSL